MTEMLDVFDDRMNHLGIADRDEVHAKGLWHQTFHCWIIRRQGDNKYVLFQRRGSEKRSYPNTLDITAAGHLATGESRLDGLRELNEELGIHADPSKLRYLGIRMSSAHVGKIFNQEFAHVHLLEVEQDLNEYRLQASEVDGLVQMEVNAGLQLFAGESTTAHVVGYQVDAQGAFHEVNMAVSCADIIPRIDNYYYKVFIMTERYFQGNPHIAI